MGSIMAGIMDGTMENITGSIMEITEKSRIEQFETKF